MKANYGPRIVRRDRKDIQLNEKGRRIAAEVWLDAQEQFDLEKQRITEAVLGAVLVSLQERYHWRGPTMARVYMDAAELIAGWRFDLCEEYEARKARKPGETSEEVTALLMRLKDNGFDLRAWESAMDYDPATGTITWKEIKS